jgi:hypothetical protein
MKFKIILKTKNEENLIDLWIRYYSKMVGKENIVIFDNNSTSPKVLEVYKNHLIEVRNIDVPNSIHQYSKNKDFYEEVFANYDWFAVLDTDEFLCTYRDGIFSADSVLETLANSNDYVLGSTWLSQMHLNDSNEYFKVNNGILNKRYGKAVFRTAYPKIRKVIYSHNLLCKDEEGNCESNLNCNLILLHLDRTDPDFRIKNCIEMCLHSSSYFYENRSFEENKLRMKVHEELKKIKLGFLPSKSFLEIKFPHEFMDSVHKLREIQQYHLDRNSYINTHYGKHNEYIKTNIINHYVYGEKYNQEIVCNKTTIFE